MRFVFVYNTNFSQTIKSNVLSMLFIGLVCFSACLNIRLYHVHKQNANKSTMPSSSAMMTTTTTTGTRGSTDKSLLSSLSDNRPVVINTHTQQLSFEAAAAATATATATKTTTMYSKSTTLPQWMKDYFDWHNQQMITVNDSNYQNYRFLILRCSNVEEKCGGVADRLKGLPFFIAAAASSTPKRIFLIRWERPTKLENFLVPHEINWSVPTWFYSKFTNFQHHPHAYYIPRTKRILMGLKKYTDVIVIEGLIQDYYGGSSNYYKFDCEMDIHCTMNVNSTNININSNTSSINNKKQFNEEYYQNNDAAGWDLYENIFHDLWYTLFTPSPSIAILVKEKMRSTKLRPNEFATSHYRAFYAIEHQKESKEEVQLIAKTINSLNCASKLQPGSPIFFASDSQIAVQTARNYNNRIPPRQGDHNNPNITADHRPDRRDRHPIVTFTEDHQEALHLDKKDQWTSGNIADFYPTFVDLLIMAEAKCMALGVGGFGRFANMISRDPTCVIRHDNEGGGGTPCKWYDTVEDHTEDW